MGLFRRGRSRDEEVDQVVSPGAHAVPERRMILPRGAAYPIPDRRRYGRFPQDMLTCNLGDVVDLSRGGMRVRGRRVRKGPMYIELRDENRSLRLPGEITRVMRSGLFKCEIGIQFVDLTPELERELAAWSMLHRQRRSWAA